MTAVCMTAVVHDAVCMTAVALPGMSTVARTFPRERVGVA
jgi:hypothetical protein